MNLLSTEARCRRSCFVAGHEVVLADEQKWMVPCRTVPDYADEDTAHTHRGLLLGILEADDDADRRRNELALIIFLLRQNYKLTSAELQALLAFPNGSGALLQAQRDFRLIADAHLRDSAWEPEPETSCGLPVTWVSRLRMQLTLSGRLRRLWLGASES